MFRRQRDPLRRDSALTLQFDPDSGRNLSDSTHPDYDPATDPELRESALGIEGRARLDACRAGTGLEGPRHEAWRRRCQRTDGTLWARALRSRNAQVEVWEAVDQPAA